MMRLLMTLLAILLATGFLIVPASGAAAASPQETRAASAPSPLRQLTSRDPLVRLRAAEELARRADPEQRKLVEGYRLQEKNERVRLALDWALYRMGKNEALFAVVNDLDTARRGQASNYLSQIEGPRPLYLFLDRVKDRAKTRLIEVLGVVGDAETIERLRPLVASPDKEISTAARLALDDISARLAQAGSEGPGGRPRKLGRPREESETP